MAETNAHRPSPNASKLVVRLGNIAWEVSQGEETEHTEPITDPMIERHRPMESSPWKASGQIPFSQARKHTTGRALKNWALKGCFTGSRALQRAVVAMGTYSRQILFPSQQRRTVTGLNGGLVMGMMLGCLAMFLFHQITPASVSSTPKTQTTNERLAKVINILPGKTVSVAGYRVYMITDGSYSNENQATVRAHQLQQKGIASTVLPIHGFSVVSEVCVAAADAQSLVSRIYSKDHLASLFMMQATARTVPVLAGASNAESQSVSSFISEAVSGLLSLTAWTSDNGARTDALQSVTTALGDFPTDKVTADTGLTDQLMPIKTQLVSAYQSIAKNDKVGTQQHVLSGLLALERIEGINRDQQ